MCSRSKGRVLRNRKRYGFVCGFEGMSIISLKNAEVAELADAQASGACGR